MNALVYCFRDRIQDLDSDAALAARR